MQFGSLNKFAKHSNIAVSTVHDCFRRGKNPRTTTCLKMAKALDVPFEKYFELK